MTGAQCYKLNVQSDFMIKLDKSEKGHVIHECKSTSTFHFDNEDEVISKFHEIKNQNYKMISVVINRPLFINFILELVDILSLKFCKYVNFKCS